MSRTAAAAMYEAQQLHQDNANKILGGNTKAVQEMGIKIDKLRGQSRIQRRSRSRSHTVAAKL